MHYINNMQKKIRCLLQKHAKACDSTSQDCIVLPRLSAPTLENTGSTSFRSIKPVVADPPNLCLGRRRSLFRQEHENAPMPLYMAPPSCPCLPHLRPKAKNMETIGNMCQKKIKKVVSQFDVPIDLKQLVAVVESPATDM